MKELKNIIKALYEVYSEKKYFLFSALFSFFVFSLNAVIGNYKLLLGEFSVTLFFNLLMSAHSNMSEISFSVLILISLLSGIVFSLSLFLLKRQITYSTGISFSGIIASILTPACSSCALGLAGILGIGGFLSVLPFKGMELGILGIILLVLSIFYQSNKIATKVCAIDEN